MDNIKLDGIPSKIKWKTHTCFTSYFKFWGCFFIKNYKGQLQISFFTKLGQCDENWLIIGKLHQQTAITKVSKSGFAEFVFITTVQCKKCNIFDSTETILEFYPYLLIKTKTLWLLQIRFSYCYATLLLHSRR